MRIKQFTEQYGITSDTARYYEDEGLLHPIRLDNGYRDYDDNCERAMKFITVLKRLGFSLQEIKFLLQLEKTPITEQCNRSSVSMFNSKIQHITSQILFYQSALKALELVTELMGNGKYEENQQLLDHLVNEMYISHRTEI